MAASLIDGKAFAAGLRARLREQVAALVATHGITPGLAVVLVGDDPASHVYVRNKGKQCREAGMASFEHRLPQTVTQADLLALVAQLNADPAVHGILVQLPLPRHLDSTAVIAAIAPEKDVDGFHPVNVGRLWSGLEGFVPCTPLGCLLLLREHVGNLAGRHAVVVGRSNIVGKPMAALLLRENCTVTIAHSRTQDLAAECRRADILVAAVGQPEFIRADWIKPDAVVIDVGINRTAAGTLVGDVDFAGAAQVASALTPVPGGVGPMTIACLLQNTYTAAARVALAAG
jgi:methylenetetrahydrofolate dehydrogenase (NADP+)/methenyltetrahydrofolate cyclohydrolase